MLSVVHSPHGESLWDTALTNWRTDDTSTLIVAGPLVRHRVLVREVTERGTLTTVAIEAWLATVGVHPMLREWFGARGTAGAHGI